MANASAEDITRLLLDWGDGDRAALDRLVPLVYAELRRTARRQMRREPSDNTLQTTALVNEAYLRLVDYERVRPRDRGHFLAIAAQAMRRILVEHARGRRAARRGGGAPRVPLDEAAGVTDGRAGDLLALDNALSKLAAVDPRKARVVELKYFGGLTIEETAEALGEAEHAAEIDPLSPAKLTGVGDVLYMARRYDDAIAYYRKALEMDPNFAYGQWARGRALIGKREYEEAVAALRRAVPLSGDSPDEHAELARAYALAGRRGEALELLGALHRLAERRYVAPATFASIYAALDDRERAFAWLERARKERDFLLVMLRVEPMFDQLRDDSRFDALLESMDFSG